MAAVVETALNSQSGVNGARAIIKPESTLIWHSLHLLYLYDELHQNENLNATSCAPAGHFSAISVRATFPLALQSAETGLQLLCFPTAPTFPASQTVTHLSCGSHLSVVYMGLKGGSGYLSVVTSMVQTAFEVNNNGVKDVKKAKWTTY